MIVDEMIWPDAASGGCLMQLVSNTVLRFCGQFTKWNDLMSKPSINSLGSRFSSEGHFHS